jgi:hypothetical protein
VKARVRSSVCASLLASFIATTAFAQPGAAPPTPPAPPPLPARVAVPQAAAPVSAVPEPTRAELRRRRVAVHVESTRPGAVLERRVVTKESQGAFIVLPFKSTEATWEQVCVTPCSVDLDRFSSYRVSAQNHIAGSKTFTLPQHGDSLELKVKAGNLLLHHTGQAMTGMGIIAFIVGGSLLFTASDFRHADDARAAGVITGGAGIVLAAIGIPLSIISSTKVHAENDEEIAKVYENHGRAIPFLPDVDLGHGFTLTQHGIVF